MTVQSHRRRPCSHHVVLLRTFFTHAVENELTAVRWPKRLRERGLGLSFHPQNVPQPSAGNLLPKGKLPAWSRVPHTRPPWRVRSQRGSLVTAGHHSQLGQPPHHDGRASSRTADFSFPFCPVQKPKDLSGCLVLMKLCCYPQFAQYFVCSSPQRPVALRSIQRLGPAMH